jgi:hypothetical protein
MKERGRKKKEGRKPLLDTPILVGYVLRVES